MINKYVSPLLVACAAITCLLGTIANPVYAASTLPAGFSESVVLSGLEQPTSVHFSPDGRVFVTEKSGLIKVFASLSATTPTVFHDLRTNVHNFWDRGLMGLALHPNFPTVPSVYVIYTYDKDPHNPQVPRWGTPGATSDGCPTPPGATTDGCVVSGRLSRLQASSVSSNVSTGTESVLVEGWGQQYPGHSMDTVMFGPDGALYASAGDGASFTFADYGQDGSPLNPLGDPPVGIGVLQTPPTAEGGRTRSQSLRRVSGPAVLNGTLIRIDPFTGSALANNPLSASADPNARRIVGYGFRNPFRFTFRPGTNEVWVGDVGDNNWEEIDRIPNPVASTVGNFGWPCYEGAGPHGSFKALGLNICNTLYTSGSAIPPYFTYSHSQQVVAGETCPTGSSAISGIAFNRGGTYPAAYQGALFFSDSSRKCIWSMFAGANGLPDPATRATFVAGAALPVDLQIGPGGDLFYVDFNGGTIRRIQYTSGNQAPNAVIQATPLSGPTPLTVTFDGRASSDPNPGDTLTYSWDLNGDGLFGDALTAQTSFTYTQAKLYNVQLRVTDNQGAADIASVSIRAGNSSPTAFIDTPGASTQWQVGQSITFSGHATDPNEALPPDVFSWEIILHHCPSNCHTHPIQSFSGVMTGSFPAPDHDYPSHLEIKLTVTDAGGLTDTKSVLLYPRTVILNFESAPSGLQLAVGSSSSPTPFTRTVILGSKNSVSAGTPQAFGGTNYKFVSWSDGGNQSHTITGTAAATYTATYEVTTDPIPLPPSDNGGGGGCTLDSTGTGDAMLPALFLVVLGLLLMRIKQRANKADRT